MNKIHTKIRAKFTSFHIMSRSLNIQPLQFWPIFQWQRYNTFSNKANLKSTWNRYWTYSLQKYRSENIKRLKASRIGCYVKLNHTSRRDKSRKLNTASYTKISGCGWGMTLCPVRRRLALTVAILPFFETKLSGRC